MDSQIIILALRLIHIVGGVLWVGAVLLSVMFLYPAVWATGPQGGRIMQELMERRRLPVYMNVVAGLTMLSGIVLYWRATAATDGAWASSRPGMVFGFGAAATIIAAIVGGAIAAPSGKKLGKLAPSLQGGSPSAEQAAQIEALRRRITGATRAVATLLIIAAAAMATARYL